MAKEQASQQAEGKGFSLSVIKTLYFLPHALLLFFVALRHFSWIGLSLSLIVLLVTAYFYILKERRQSIEYQAIAVKPPACAHLPALFFADVAALAAIFIPELEENFDLHAFSAAWGHLMAALSAHPSLLAIGGLAFLVAIIILCLSFSKPILSWLNPLALFIFGLFLLLVVFNLNPLEKPWKEIFKYASFCSALAAMVCCLLPWGLAYVISSVSDPGRLMRTENLFLTILLLAIGTIFAIAEKDFWSPVAEKISAQLKSLLGHPLPRWIFLFCLVVFVGFALLMYRYKKERLGCDAHVCAASMLGILLFAALPPRYFIFNGAVGLFFLLGCLYSLHQEKCLKKAFGCINLVFLMALTASLVFIVIFIRFHLYWNMLVSVLFGLLFYRSNKGGNPADHSQANWRLALLCIPLQAAAFAVTRGINALLIGFLAIAAAAACGAFYILTKLLTSAAEQKIAKASVCILLAATCFLAVTRYGSIIRVQPDEDFQEAVVSITPNGKNNRITSSSYRWISLTEPDTAPNAIFQKQTKLSIQPACLVLHSTDQKGLIAVQIVFFPRQF